MTIERTIILNAFSCHSERHFPVILSAVEESPFSITYGDISTSLCSAQYDSNTAPLCKGGCQPC